MLASYCALVPWICNADASGQVGEAWAFSNRGLFLSGSKTLRAISSAEIPVYRIEKPCANVLFQYC